MFVLGCLYVVVASRRQPHHFAPSNRFEGRSGCGEYTRSWNVVRARRSFYKQSHIYLVASRMTPKPNDDVEYVVGRARGDVTPEEAHEPSLLVALVEEDTARHVNTAKVISVFGASTPYRNKTLLWAST